MSSMRTILTSTALVGALGIGYAMWSVISPSEGRKKELLKHLPEANRVNMDETRRRNAQLMQVLKEASENPENIARAFPPPKN